MMGISPQLFSALCNLHLPFRNPDSPPAPGFYSPGMSSSTRAQMDCGSEKHFAEEMEPAVQANLKRRRVTPAVENAGVSNSRLWFEVHGSQKIVFRAYEHQYVGITEDDWNQALFACSDVGLIDQPNTWSYKSLPDEVIVGNGFLQMLQPRDTERATLYAAYDSALRALMALWEKHCLLLSDLHDKNLVVAQVEGGVSLVVCDGKLAGATRSPGHAHRRLGTKLAYAQQMHKYHVWMLEQYRAFVGNLATNARGA